MRRPTFLTPTVERRLERVGFAIYLLAGIVLVARAYAAPAPSSAATRSESAEVRSPSSSSTPVATATTTPATSSGAVATPPTPQPTRVPLAVTPYVNAGRRFAALTAPNGYVLLSPVSGTVRVVVYQLLGGDIRVGSNVPTEPFYPYVTITSSDVKLILRPGALRDDVELLVKDGDPVRAGSPIFRIVGQGASSWHAFYDRGLSAQILVSASARPSGAELDPAPLFAR